MASLGDEAAPTQASQVPAGPLSFESEICWVVSWCVFRGRLLIREERAELVCPGMVDPCAQTWCVLAWGSHVHGAPVLLPS